MTATAPSQEVQAKAARYLLEGKVRIDYADQRSLTALVHGTRPAPYHVMCVNGTWRCDCPAQALCSHVVACQAVWRPAPVLVAADAFALLPEAED